MAMVHQEHGAGAGTHYLVPEHPDANPVFFFPERREREDILGEDDDSDHSAKHIKTPQTLRDDEVIPTTGEFFAR